jgi:hypothetical protein
LRGIIAGLLPQKTFTTDGYSLAEISRSEELTRLSLVFLTEAWLTLSVLGKDLLPLGSLGCEWNAWATHFLIHIIDNKEHAIRSASSGSKALRFRASEAPHANLESSSFRFEL